VKIILDEMLPAAVADLLSGHDVATVKAAGYTGLSNGEADIEPQAARIRDAVAEAKPGTARRIEPE
jgi:hypothetical protein